MLGMAGSENVQGEDQKKLDILVRNSCWTRHTSIIDNHKLHPAFVRMNISCQRIAHRKLGPCDHAALHDILHLGSGRIALCVVSLP